VRVCAWFSPHCPLIFAVLACRQRHSSPSQTSWSWTAVYHQRKGHGRCHDHQRCHHLPSHQAAILASPAPTHGACPWGRER
jgi:hypothetical protein